jgi:hypothetical protein
MHGAAWFSFKQLPI